MSNNSAEQLAAETVALYGTIRTALRRANLDPHVAAEDYAAEITGGLLEGGHIQLPSSNGGSAADDVEQKVNAAIRLFGAILSSLSDSTHKGRNAATLVRSLLSSGQDALE